MRHGHDGTTFDSNHSKPTELLIVQREFMDLPPLPCGVQSVLPEHLRVTLTEVCILPCPRHFVVML